MLRPWPLPHAGSRTALLCLAALVLILLWPLWPRIAPVSIMGFHFEAFVQPQWIKSFPKSARRFAGAACLGLVSLAGPASAQGTERSWHLTGYGSQWVNADLLEIPERAVTGRLTAEDAYFAGVGLSRVIVPSFSIPLPGTDVGFHGNRI